jgi:hypothetical protein
MDKMTPAKTKPDEKMKDAQLPAGPVKAEKKPKKEKGKKQKVQPVELPLLVEIGFSFAGIFLILVDLTVAYISYTSGANWIDIFIRIVIATVVLGFILWMLLMNLSNGSLAAALEIIEEENKKEKEKAKELEIDKATGIEA